MILATKPRSSLSSYRLSIAARDGTEEVARCKCSSLTRAIKLTLERDRKLRHLLPVFAMPSYDRQSRARYLITDKPPCSLPLCLDDFSAAHSEPLIVCDITRCSSKQAEGLAGVGEL